jgi:hypothetical protein
MRVEMTTFDRVGAISLQLKFAAAECSILRLCHPARTVDITEANVINFPARRVCFETMQAARR